MGRSGQDARVEDPGPRRVSSTHRAIRAARTRVRMKPLQRLSATFLLLSALLSHIGLSPNAAPALRVSGGRSAQQQQSAAGLKLDPSLAELTRSIGVARPAQMLTDLHSLSPGAHFKQHSTDPVP